MTVRAASTDCVAASKSVLLFKAMIEEGADKPHQVFNFNTCLLWNHMTSYTCVLLKWTWHLDWKLKKTPVHMSWEVQLPGTASVGLSLTKFMRIEGYEKQICPLFGGQIKGAVVSWQYFKKMWCGLMRSSKMQCETCVCVCVLKCYEEMYSQNLMTAALVSTKSFLKKQHSACFNLRFVWTLHFSWIACWRRSSCGVTSLTFSVRTSQCQASAVTGAHFNLNAHCRMKRIYG